jgi:hypothetical protein
VSNLDAKRIGQNIEGAATPFDLMRRTEAKLVVAIGDGCIPGQLVGDAVFAGLPEPPDAP